MLKMNSEFNRLVAGTFPFSESEISGITIRIDNNTVLYRGVRKPGLRQLEYSKRTAITGVYLSRDETYAKKCAVFGIGFEMREDWKSRIPVLYRCSVEDMKLLDLSRDSVESSFSLGLYRLANRLLDPSALEIIRGLDRNWSPEERDFIFDIFKFMKLMGRVNEKNAIAIGHKKLNGIIAEYVYSLGFDGIVDSDCHILILDPEKITIDEERRLDPKEFLRD
jgi:hypothetical protein